MLLTDLQEKLNEAIATWSEANSQWSSETQKERAIVERLGQFRQKSQYVEVLRIERDELPLQRAKTAEARAAVDQALVALGVAESEYDKVRGKALTIQANIATLTTRLGPGGYFAHHIGEVERQLKMFQDMKAGEIARRDALQNELAQLTDSTAGELRRYRRHPALTK